MFLITILNVPLLRQIFISLYASQKNHRIYWNLNSMMVSMSYIFKPPRYKKVPSVNCLNLTFFLSPNNTTDKILTLNPGMNL